MAANRSRCKWQVRLDGLVGPLLLRLVLLGPHLRGGRAESKPRSEECQRERSHCSSVRGAHIPHQIAARNVEALSTGGSSPSQLRSVDHERSQLGWPNLDRNLGRLPPDPR